MLRKLCALLLAAVLFDTPDGALFGQSGDAITTPCNAHLGTIGDNDPHAYDKYFEHARLPKEAEGPASERLPNTVDLIAVAPVNAEEYGALFFHDNDKEKARPITVAQTAEVEKVHATLKSKFGREAGDRFDHKNVQEFLRAKPATYLIVIGHNEGGRFRTLNGSGMFLDDIVAAARPDQRLILISCNSAEAVSKRTAAATIGQEITYDQAFDIAGRMRTYIEAAGRAISLAEVQAELTRVVGSETGRKVAYFIMLAACAGGAAIVVALVLRQLDPCEDKNSSKCGQGKGASGRSAGSRPHAGCIHCGEPLVGVTIQHA